MDPCITSISCSFSNSHDRDIIDTYVVQQQLLTVNSSVYFAVRHLEKEALSNQARSGRIEEDYGGPEGTGQYI